jgi:hypothetical protein
MALVVVCAALALTPLSVLSQASATRTANKTEEGPRWQELKPAQRSVLKPLEHEWAGIDAPRKQKWLEIAARHPNLPPAEQDRISARMTAWAKMTPTERGQARLNFQESRQLTPQERQARWEAYQALPTEQKNQLATRAVPAAAPARSGEVPHKSSSGKESGSRDGSQDKSNIVPNPAYAAPRKQVAPTVVQAQPGATTTLMSRHSVPPSHQQPGLPKIAASPGFVDKATLLPQRGPQGAAIRSAAASDAKSPAVR